MTKDKRKINNPILYAIIINVIVLAAALFLYIPFFEENDDAFLSMIAEGAFGVREAHLIYPNIILGFIYKGLYAVCPVIRWHTVLQYLFVFISLTLLTYMIQIICVRRAVTGASPEDAAGTESGEDTAKEAERRAAVTGRLLSAVVLLSLFYESYVSLQYSKTATLISAVGLAALLFCFEVRDDESNGAKFIKALAFVLLVYGMLLRGPGFMLGTLFMLPVGIYELIKAVKRERTGAFVGIFALAGGIFLIVSGFDLAIYYTDPAWSTFTHYNETRTNLLDYRYDLLDYDKYGSRLEELGISENDALMILTWQFGDDDVLTEDVMKTVLGGMPAKRFDIEMIKAFAQHIYDDMLVLNPAAAGVLLLVLFALFTFRSDGDKGRMAVLISMLVIFAAVHVFFEYSGRWCHRIVFAAILALIISVVYNTTKEPSAVSYKILLILLVILNFAALMGNRFEYNDFVRKEPDHRALFAEMAADPGTLYVGDTFTFQNSFKYEVFKPYAQGSLSDFVTVGSWYINSPITKAITLGAGYDNPVAALAGAEDGSDVVLIDNYFPEEKALFIKEHYDGVSFSGPEEKYGFNLYKVNRSERLSE